MIVKCCKCSEALLLPGDIINLPSELVRSVTYLPQSYFHLESNVTIIASFMVLCLLFYFQNMSTIS